MCGQCSCLPATENKDTPAIYSNLSLCDQYSEPVVLLHGNNVAWYKEGSLALLADLTILLDRDDFTRNARSSIIKKLFAL